MGLFQNIISNTNNGYVELHSSSSAQSIKNVSVAQDFISTSDTGVVDNTSKPLNINLFEEKNNVVANQDKELNNTPHYEVGKESIASHLVDDEYQQPNSLSSSEDSIKIKKNNNGLINIPLDQDFNDNELDTISDSVKVDNDFIGCSTKEETNTSELDSDLTNSPINSNEKIFSSDSGGKYKSDEVDLPENIQKSEYNIINNECLPEEDSSHSISYSEENVNLNLTPNFKKADINNIKLEVNDKTDASSSTQEFVSEVKETIREQSDSMLVEPLKNKSVLSDYIRDDLNDKIDHKRTEVESPSATGVTPELLKKQNTDTRKDKFYESKIKDSRKVDYKTKKNKDTYSTDSRKRNDSLLVNEFQSDFKKTDIISPSRQSKEAAQPKIVIGQVNVTVEVTSNKTTTSRINNSQGSFISRNYLKKLR